MLLIAFMVFGAVFYIWQNSGNLPGGKIALSKIFWLGFVILFWFFLPGLLLLDGVSTKVDNWLVLFHLVNVCLRAIIELFMMYQYQNWQPIYGITHDIISMFLLLALVIVFRNKLSFLVEHFLFVLVIMFAVEASFAHYMLHNVIDVNNPVFFVPQSSEHQVIFSVTWLAVSLLSLYLIFFTQHWCKYWND